MEKAVKALGGRGPVDCLFFGCHCSRLCELTEPWHAKAGVVGTWREPSPPAPHPGERGARGLRERHGVSLPSGGGLCGFLSKDSELGRLKPCRSWGVTRSHWGGAHVGRSGPTSVPAAREVAPRRIRAVCASCGKATSVDSKANQRGHRRPTARSTLNHSARPVDSALRRGNHPFMV